jgi:two-component system sensor histidine kinase DesK
MLVELAVSLWIFGLARLAQLIRFIHATRTELAELAIVNERMRFARDLHDLLGYSLSSITLKSELTRRLVGSNPGRARDELAQVIDIARQALADVRTVASGYRTMSLEKEASSVSALLAEAGISAQVSVDCGALDERVDTVLATVLREAVTNLLRHSAVRNCVVEARVAGDTVSLKVANDGVPRSAPSGRRGGGLDNLSTRLLAIGGRLTAKVTDNGWFSVLAEAPVTAAPGAGRRAGARVREDGN